MSLVYALFDWLAACLSTYFPQEYVRAPVMDCGTSRAVRQESNWKCEQWMCRYTGKMVGGVCAGQCAQVRLILVKENCHILRAYHTSNWLCCPVRTTATTTTTMTKEFIKVLFQTYYNNLLFQQAIVAHSHSDVNNMKRYYQYTVHWI